MVADALSTRNLVDCCAVSEVHPGLKMFHRLGQDYEKDDETRKILEESKTHLEYKILQRKIYFTGDGRMRLYIPKGQLRNSVMSELMIHVMLVTWESKGQLT